jgi:putative chitinase
MLLKKGSNGEDVKKLQSKLGLKPDGVFGSGTEMAVKNWQASKGLTADGIVGDGTWSKMFGEEKQQIKTVLTEPSPIPNLGGLKLEKLKGHIPDNVIAMIPETAEKFKIDTPLKLAHFLSQCGHESGGFKVTQENLNYSAKGLRGIFAKYFPTDQLAEQYQRKPEAIASRVYGGRMGNGLESTKEGFRFRGRGYIQLTGKDNYVAFGKAINEDLVSNPDLVSTKYALLSASWFFQRCLPKCKDATDASVTAVTKCVNGGTIGLTDRIKHFKEYYSLLM